MVVVKGRAFNVDAHLDMGLGELACTPGGLIAFDNGDFEMPQPFLLAIVDRLSEGFDKYRGIELLFEARQGEREEWTLYTRGQALGLWTPEQRHRGGRTLPHFEVMPQGETQKSPYVVE